MITERNYICVHIYNISFIRFRIANFHNHNIHCNLNNKSVSRSYHISCIQIYFPKAKSIVLNLQLANSFAAAAISAVCAFTNS